MFTTIITVYSILVTIALIISIIANYRGSTKIMEYEEAYDILDEQNGALEIYLRKTHDQISLFHNEIERMDVNRKFSRDDEVGIFYDKIKEFDNLLAEFKQVFEEE